jgi:hypothetical protein
MSNLPTITPDAGALSETPRPQRPAGGSCTTCGLAIEREVNQGWRHVSGGSEFCPPEDEWASAVAKRLKTQMEG